MFELEGFPPPIPQSASEQMPASDFEYVSSCVAVEKLANETDAGYFLPGDTVMLQRSSGRLDTGWAFVGVDAENLVCGVFVKMINGHRAQKSYPFNWDKL